MVYTHVYCNFNNINEYQIIEMAQRFSKTPYGQIGKLDPNNL